MSAVSYQDRIFVVDDPDARVRNPDDLRSSLRDPTTGDVIRIAVGRRLQVHKVRRLEMGGLRSRIFALVRDADSGEEIGWTSTGNLLGDFIGETLDLVRPAPGAGQYAATAAWAGGKYLGQITLIEIVDATLEIEVIAKSTAEPFLAMCAAARDDRVAIQLTSGFRTWAEQKYLYDSWVRRLPGYYPAAKPGNSSHQNGVAFDIRVEASYDSEQYLWLAREATGHGFLRTVSGEPHHWEYRPAEAAAARAAGRHKRASVSP